MTTTHFSRHLSIVLCLMCAFLLVGNAVTADDSPKNESRSQQVKTKESPTFAAMRELARDTRVEILDDKGNVLREAVLLEQPILRYGDPTRAIAESTLWIWVDSKNKNQTNLGSRRKQETSQPVFFQKIEVFHFDPKHPLWTFCYASASNRKLQINWQKIRKNTRTKALDSISFQSAPQPVDSMKAQEFQMRKLARSLTVKENNGQSIQDLRGMPRPLYQYQSPDNGILKGGIFGYSVGTNPDLLVSIQLVENKANKHWKLSPIKMTATDISILQQKKKLWQAPAVHDGHHGHWGYFFTPRDPGIK